jgi:hypothetical protein
MSTMMVTRVFVSPSKKLDEKFVAAAVDIPVDAPDFVAGLILAILREIDTESQIWRLMQARDEAFDDGARKQLHVLDANENLGSMNRFRGLSIIGVLKFLSP